MKKYNIKVNGISYEVEVEEVGSSVQAVQPVQAAPKAEHPSALVSAPKTGNFASGAESVTSPMPGTIVKINVKSGDSVKKGDVFLVLEAMKMENDITAPADCTIASVNVNQGATVSTGDVLITYN